LSGPPSALKREFTSDDPVSRRIHTLRDIDAQRLAAGEVIERPVSIVRELLDNSIDAGSASIQVYLKGGGLDSIKVIDDGAGMSREDLSLCLLPHTTSKINVIEDLTRTKTLGFRGEALSSIAACSQVEVISSTGEDEEVYKAAAKNGILSPLEKWRGKKGTSVQVTALFHAMPGRKKFLKRPQTEGTLCKSMVIEKALPFPKIGFKLFMQDELKLFLPPASRMDRISGAFSALFPEGSLFQVSDTRNDFSVTLISGLPSLFRRDRKYIQVFVNNRRIQEYSLLQAVTYGFSGFLPGGLFPYSFLFIDVDPEFIDFNIHPTKKEVRFRNLPEIHHTVTSLLRKTLGEGGEKHTEAMETPPLFSFKQGTSPANFSDLREKTPYYSKPASAEQDTTPSFSYLGQAFRLFLMAEKENSLFFIDQHAAHERYLFDRFKAAPPAVQDLLIPIRLELEKNESDLLEKKKETYHSMGIGLERISSECWKVTRVPAPWTSDKDSIIELLTAAATGQEDMEKDLFSRLACRDAVKEGDLIDDITAYELIDYVFSLNHPRCPHGRPIVFTLTKDDLFRQVERSF